MDAAVLVVAQNDLPLQTVEQVGVGVAVAVVGADLDDGDGRPDGF